MYKSPVNAHEHCKSRQYSEHEKSITCESMKSMRKKTLVLHMRNILRVRKICEMHVT